MSDDTAGRELTPAEAELAAELEAVRAVGENRISHEELNGELNETPSDDPEDDLA